VDDIVEKILTYIATDGKLPTGTDVTADLSALVLDYEKSLRLTLGFASVWTKVQCEECACSNWLFAALFGTPKKYEWNKTGKEKWVRCNISETSFGKSEKNFVNNADNTAAVEGMTVKMRKKIISDCEKQAKNSCD